MQKLRHAGGILFAGCLLLGTSLVRAEDSDLWLRYSENEQGAQDYGISLNLAVSADDFINLAAGEARSEIETLAGQREITTNHYLLGYNTFRLAPWGINVYYAYWGKDNELVIHSLGMDLDYLFDSWQVGLSLEYRNIELYTRATMQSPVQRNSSDSYGYGVLIQKDWESTSWNLSGHWYDYSDDPSQLYTLQGLRNYGGRTLSHAGSLEDWNAGSALIQRLGDLRVSLNYLYSVAATNQAVSETVSLDFEYKFNSTVTASLEYGRVFAEATQLVPDETQTDYAAVGIGFSF